MTDRELRDETVTLLLAGHETTANALSWTWYLLALHPELQERVSNEAEAVAHGRPLSAEDLPRLKFAEQVLKESMRLYPPAFIIGREATAAFAAGEYVIPRGATVFLSQWVSHRDSRRFPDPQEFRPERWTTQFEAMLPRYAYFPFGGGPRVCVGNTFAMIEAVLLLSTLARHWRFELAGDEPIGLLPTVTLRPDQPIWMRLTQRTASPHASSEPQRHTITET